MKEETNLNTSERKEVFKQLSKSIITLSALVLGFIVLIIVIVFLNKKPEQTTSDNSVIDIIETVPEKTDVIKEGEKLFKANCTACHAVNRKLIGPALAGVSDRREKEWLYRFIRNNVELRESGDKTAIELYEQYNQSPMNVFLQFSDTDIDNIIAYIEFKQD